MQERQSGQRAQVVIAAVKRALPRPLAPYAPCRTSALQALVLPSSVR